MTDTDPDRRRVLGTIAACGALGVAGCAGTTDDDAPADGGDAPADGGDAPADGDDADDAPGDDAPDHDDAGTHEFDVETVADGVTHPWAIAFLPDDRRLLVTERDGTLLAVDRDGGGVESVAGTPTVDAAGQGGLLDVEVDPDYPAEPWAYLTYSASNDAGETATHVGRGRLVLNDGPDAPRLDGFEPIHVAEPFVDSNAHYGSRVVVGPDGALYVTAGDRQFKDFGPDHVAQDRGNELGATLRLARDGSVPADNPFVDDPDAVDTLFSYGHRNAQGMSVRPGTDEIWQSEHGERGGDAIHVVGAGENHGWPVAHYGCAYGTDDPVGDRPDERPGIVDPAYHWPCGSGGFPPAGTAFYAGDAFPAWRGDLFVGNLAGQYLGRLVVDDGAGSSENGYPEIREADPLLDGRGWRVRDVAVAPDTGHLYVAVDDDAAPVVRLMPV